MSQNNENQQGFSLDLRNEISKRLAIHKNISQEVIVITADKMELILGRTREILTSQREWWTPLGLLISFITTLCTSEFKDTFGLHKEFWHAVFCLFSLGSIIWLGTSFYKLCKNWKKGNIDHIMKNIKLKSGEALLENEGRNPITAH